MNHLIGPNPIPNSNTWLQHPWRTFFWHVVWYDQIKYLSPIWGTPPTNNILLMYRLIWPNPIPNSNTWVHHSWQRFCWCIIWYDPIQYPIPIHGYTTHDKEFVDASSDVPQSDTQFQIPSPPPSPLQTKIRISFFWKPNSAPNLMTHQRAIMSIWIQYLSPMHDYTVPLKLIGNVNFGE